jgi:hypothetical protein
LPWFDDSGGERKVASEAVASSVAQLKAQRAIEVRLATQPVIIPFSLLGL